MACPIRFSFYYIIQNPTFGNRALTLQKTLDLKSTQIYRKMVNLFLGKFICFVIRISVDVIQD